MCRVTKIKHLRRSGFNISFVGGNLRIRISYTCVALKQLVSPRSQTASEGRVLNRAVLPGSHSSIFQKREESKTRERKDHMSLKEGLNHMYTTGNNSIT
jgi:hypothetical protein